MKALEIIAQLVLYPPTSHTYILSPPPKHTQFYVHDAQKNQKKNLSLNMVCVANKRNQNLALNITDKGFSQLDEKVEWVGERVE